jgi:two-component system sensor histidine kinase MtrB
VPTPDPRTRHTAAVDAVSRRRPGADRFGLRVRAATAAALGGLAVTVALSLGSYFTVRSSLLGQQADLAERQAVGNARIVQRQLLDPEVPVGDVLPALSVTQGTRVLLLYDGRLFGRGIGSDEDAIPDALRAQLDAGVSARQWFVDDDGGRLAVGIVLPAVAARYVELTDATDLERTLGALRTALAAGTIIATLGGAGIGWWSAGRALRPLRRVADAAAQLARGGLSTRLAPESDPDLARLVGSFNDMADAVESRIEREARFASDTSHELRTPLTALTAAADVLARRRDDLPERARVALDVLVRQLDRFGRLVLDLLEISRLDTGTADRHVDLVDLADLARRTAVAAGFGDLEVRTEPASADVRAEVDRRHVDRVLVNLLENAERHGGGPRRLLVEATGGTVTVHVDDAGPGVPAELRDRIFERFARGPGSGDVPGTGLGLSLATAHAAVLGGSVRVTDAPGGGARFSLVLPRRAIR